MTYANSFKVVKHICSPLRYIVTFPALEFDNL